MTVKFSENGRSGDEAFSVFSNGIKEEIAKAVEDSKLANEIAEEVIFKTYDNYRGLMMTFPTNPQRYINKLKKNIKLRYNELVEGGVFYSNAVITIHQEYKLGIRLIREWLNEE